MDAQRDEIDVSVIMLTYNHENYIAQAIESVLMQKTNLRYELIIGDDASTDRTPEIVREYAEKYPDIIVPVLREKNLGATKNGWDLTFLQRGKFCSPLEGDDFWLDPCKMQKQYDFLNANPQYVGCCGKCVVVDENGTPNYTKTPSFVLNKKVFTLNDYLNYWKMPGQGGTIMFRNVYSGKDPSFFSILYEASPQVADKTDMLLLLQHAPFYCSNDLLSAYRYINRRDGDNYFSRHYANPYRNHDMFLYSCNLEDWARKNLGIRTEIGKRQKTTRFCRFTEECIRGPSWKRLKCWAEMLARSHAPGRYAWYAVKTLIEME